MAPYAVVLKITSTLSVIFAISELLQTEFFGLAHLAHGQTLKDGLA
jgi:hypothetical protein